MATFFSKSAKLKIVLVPARKGENAVEGKRIAFDNGRYVTNDKEEIKALREYSHHLVYEETKDTPKPERKQRVTTKAKSSERK